jgi:hypothetical protein
MTIPDAPLPPWARRIQQTWLFQVVALPIFLGFGSAIMVQGCLANGIEHIQRACLMGAINSTIISFVTVIVSGHSVASPAFHDDGSSNKAVAEVVEATKPMPAAEAAKVAVHLQGTGGGT